MRIMNDCFSIVMLFIILTGSEFQSVQSQDVTTAFSTLTEDAFTLSTNGAQNSSKSTVPAENIVSVTQSQTTTHSVTDGPPLVEVQQAFYSVSVGNNVTLLCNVTSDHVITDLYWLKTYDSGMTRIDSNSNYGIHKYDGSTINTPSLTILFVDQSDAGTYTCFAASNMGTGQSTDIILNITISQSTTAGPSIIYNNTFTFSTDLEKNSSTSQVYTESGVVTIQNVTETPTQSTTIGQGTITAFTTINDNSYSSPSSLENNITTSQSTTELILHSVTEGVTTTQYTTEPITQNVTERVTTTQSATEPITQNVTERVTTTQSATVPITQNVTERATTTQYASEPITQNVTERATTTQTATEPITQNVTERAITTQSATEPITQNVTERATTTQFTTELILHSVTEGVTTTQSATEPITQNGTERATTTQSATEPITQSVTEDVTSTQSATEPITQNVTEGVTTTQSTTEPITQSFITTKSATEPITQNVTKGVNTTQSTTDPITQSVTTTQSSTEPITQNVTTILSATEPITQSVTEGVTTTQTTTTPITRRVTEDVTTTQTTTEPITRRVTEDVTTTQTTTEPITRRVTEDVTTTQTTTEPITRRVTEDVTTTQPYTQSVTDGTRTCSGVSHFFKEVNATVHFTPAMTGSTAVSSEICMTDKEPVATADCIRGQQSQSELINFVFNPNCNFNNLETSPFTDALAQLSTITIDNTNSKAVIDSLNTVTANSSQLTSLDVIYVTGVFENLANLTQIDETVFEDTLSVVDNILEVDETTLANAQNRGSATNRILEMIESLQQNVDLRNKSSIQILRPNILVDVYNVSAMESPVVGVQIEGEKNQSLSTSVINRLYSDSNISVQSLDATIMLPPELIKGNNTRLSLNIYNNLKLFSVSSDNKHFLPNSRVIAASVNIDGVAKKSLDGYQVQTIFYPLIDSENNECGYWDYTLNDNSGGWATDGCYVNGSVLGRLVCVCNHLTNFAVLINIGGQNKLERGIAIKIITWIGLALSIIGLSLTIVSYLFFRHLRKGRAQQTLLNLSIALLCFLVTFAAGIKQTQNVNACIAVAVLLHYFILVAFMWMLVEGILQFLSFVKIFGTYVPKFIWKSAVAAWGLPLIPIIVVLSVDYEMYKGGDAACWMSLTAFYYAFVIPVCIIMVANIIIFILVLKTLFRQTTGLKSNQSERKRVLMNLRAAVSIFILLGLTWIFGFFTIKEASVVFQYIFTLLNVFQGFFIFILFAARDPHVRSQWKKLCCTRKQKDKYKERDTITEDNRAYIPNAVRFHPGKFS